MDRPARPDDGSPARLIATMVGIVGILWLGSLAWSAVGALFSALGEATSTFAPNGRPTPAKLVAVVGTATVVRGATPTSGATPTRAAKPTEVAPSVTQTPGLTREPTPPPTVAATAAPAPTPSATTNGRAPWILLPLPAPDSVVAAGQLVVEARARGDAAISSIRLELDGAALPVSLEQRSESIWRGFATTRVSPGRHAVRATVVDDQGRTGGYRWTFEAGP